MGGCEATARALKLTASAEATLARTTERWRGFLAVALVDLAENPEPDGVTRFAAPAHTEFSGSLMYLVGPWRVFYRIAPEVVTVIAIRPLMM